MGRISDAIANVEEELEAEIAELEKALERSHQREEELADEIKDLSKDLNSHMEYIAWAEDFYPEMANQYGAIQKVRG